MKSSATTKMSSKGQVVIPEEIRKTLGLKTGSKFVVVGEDNGVKIGIERDYQSSLGSTRRKNFVI